MTEKISHVLGTGKGTRAMYDVSGSPEPACWELVSPSARNSKSPHLLDPLKIIPNPMLWETKRSELKERVDVYKEARQRGSVEDGRRG